MTAVSQLIPTYTGGISDQPDELKLPGQVRDAVNVYPDVTFGLSKRPGLTGIKTLINRCTGTFQEGNGSWFSFYRENFARKTQEIFIGCVDFQGKVSVWNASNGEPVEVYYSTDTVDPSDIENIDINTLNLCGSAPYLTHNVQDFLQFLSINNYTFITNPGKAVTMSADNVARRPWEAFIEITQLVYGREYRFDIDILNVDNPTLLRSAAEIQIIKTGDFDDDNKDPSCPANMPPTTFTVGEDDLRKGKKRGQRDLQIQIESVGIQVPINRKGDYECAYRHYATLVNGGRNIHKNDVFRIYNSKYSGDGNTPFYDVKVLRVNKEETSAEFPITGITTDNDGSTVETIRRLLNDLRDECEAVGMYAEVVGNGLYLSYGAPFTVTTSEKDLFNILAQDAIDYNNPVCVVNNVSRLPIECRAGIIAKVANSFSNEDDYWVQFKANYGVINQARENNPASGYWEEIPEPQGKRHLNPNNMPHLLMYGRKAGQTIMVVAPAAWKSRDCGTEDFNPSFENYNINQLVFYMNRLVALSQENVIMSRPGELLNFFPVSALAVSPKDPIDISATTDYSSVLQDAIVINNGLVVFSNFQQFQLHTDSDVLDPTTAKITEISRYDYNINSRPINLGTNIGFMGGSSTKSRFYEMSNIFREGPVDVMERSKIVSKSIAPNLNLIADAKDTGLFIAGSSGSDLLWCYRYFKESSQKELQSAWFKWQLPHELVFHTILDDIYYVAMRTENNNIVLASLNVESRTGPYLDLGKAFLMTIELPTIYTVKKQGEVTRADKASSLTIHRMRLNTGLTNYYYVQIQRAGKDTYQVIHEQSFMDGYNADEEQVTEDYEQVIPIYDRNINLTTRIFSDYGPFQLHSMSWEGDYNQRYYKRG